MMLTNLLGALAVVHGYGLPSLHTALDGGYLGARLVRDTFVAWFHWPARRSAA